MKLGVNWSDTIIPLSKEPLSHIYRLIQNRTCQELAGFRTRFWPMAFMTKKFPTVSTKLDWNGQSRVFWHKMAQSIKKWPKEGNKVERRTKKFWDSDFEYILHRFNLGSHARFPSKTKCSIPGVKFKLHLQAPRAHHQNWSKLSRYILSLISHVYTQDNSWSEQLACAVTELSVHY